MDATSETAAKIIDSDFGDKLTGKGKKVSENDWWDDLLERVSDLCENALKMGAERGYKRCHEIHKEKIMTPGEKSNGCVRSPICK